MFVIFHAISFESQTLWVKKCWFWRDFVAGRMVYLHSNVCSGLQKTHLFWNRVRFGRSRSSKFDDFGTYRKRVCDFLFVPHCDYGSILHRFWDTSTYWLKIAYFSYPSLIWRPRSLCCLWNFAPKLTTRKLESWVSRFHAMSISWISEVSWCISHWRTQTAVAELTRPATCAATRGS